MPGYTLTKPRRLLQVGALVFLMIWTGACAYHPKTALAPAGLPEEILLTPQRLVTPLPPLPALRAAVFAFKEPVYAPQAGQHAAVALHRQLLRAGVFREVSLELSLDIRNQPEARIIETARIRGYDVIILGELQTYFEGSHHEATRVVQEIRVLRVRAVRPETLWQARAIEQAAPIRSKDYIFVDVQGAQAPGAQVLLDRNARKFTNMLLATP